MAIGARRAFASSARRLVSARLAYPFAPRLLTSTSPLDAAPNRHPLPSAVQTYADGAVPSSGCRYRAVREEEKAELVGEVFSSVADKYDVMNDVMSGGLHRLWKDRLVRALHPFPHMHHLDVAGGTGDIAFQVLRAIREAEADPLRMAAAAGTGRSSGEGSHEAGRGARVIVCDINADMLRVGQLRAQQQGVAAQRPRARSPPAIACASAQVTPFLFSCARVPPCHHLSTPYILCLWTSPTLSTPPQPPPVLPGLASDAALEWVQGDAEDMSAVLADGSVDAYSIAFGIRNVTRIHRALTEAHRVLRKGGQFACLELSHVEDPLFRALYDTYSFNVIPAIGQAVTGDRASYQYLVESIRKFPTQRKFAHMMEQAGFRNVSYENMTGGVVALFTGFKL
ncbi:unnamed protein product [Closterium sp. Naga37s-1]|nr:unnamed protein product [Closterium sp. Naga37s-1]